jgi:hypothetical protein
VSGYAAGIVWRSALPGRLKPLVACLADFANDDGTGIFPSVEYMMWLVDLGESTVRGQLSELRKTGVLLAKKNLKGGRHLRTEYQIVFEKLPKRPSWTQLKTGREKGTESGEFQNPPASESKRVQIPDEKGPDSGVRNKEEPSVVNQPSGEPLVLAPPSSDAGKKIERAVTNQDKAKRHTAFKDLIFRFYQWRWKQQCPWDGSEAKQLSNLLAASPDLQPNDFARWLKNYGESKDISPGERPRKFLPRIHDYSVTKLNQFRRDADVRTETFDSARVRNTDDAFEQAARNLAGSSTDSSNSPSGDDSAGNRDVGQIPRALQR